MGCSSACTPPVTDERSIPRPGLLYTILFMQFGTKVRHEPIAAVGASRSAGGRDRAFGVSLASFGALAIRRRKWTASPGAGLQVAHLRQSARRQYLQGQHLRCRRED